MVRERAPSADMMALRAVLLAVVALTRGSADCPHTRSLSPWSDPASWPDGQVSQVTSTSRGFPALLTRLAQFSRYEVAQLAQSITSPQTLNRSRSEGEGTGPCHQTPVVGMKSIYFPIY